MHRSIAAPPKFYTGAGTYIIGIRDNKIVAAERISPERVLAECANPDPLRVTPTVFNALATAEVAANRMPDGVTIKLALGACCKFKGMTDLERNLPRNQNRTGP